MKTLPIPIKTALFLILPAFAFLFSSCTKASSDYVDPKPDPGYGCETSVVLRSITSAPARLTFYPANTTGGQGNKWSISLDLPDVTKVACFNCNKQVEIEAITGVTATSTVTVNVLITGEVKRYEYNQPDPRVIPTSYPVPYWLNIFSITKI